MLPFKSKQLSSLCCWGVGAAHKNPILQEEKMAERPEKAIRKYAFCTDNLKAEKVYSIINIILNVVFMVLAIYYVVVPATKLLDWNFVVSI